MRYFLGFLITIGLIILVIVLLFRGPSKPKVSTTSKTLDSYASTNAEVKLTIDGPINAQSEHDQTRITVDRNNVTYEQITGYQGSVKKMQRFDNNQEAFTVFLKALDRAGFTLGDTDKTLADERGRCALGTRYIYELAQDGKNLERFWTTSCGGIKTFKGLDGQTRDLFRAQIPNQNNRDDSIDFSF